MLGAAMVSSAYACGASAWSKHSRSRLALIVGAAAIALAGLMLAPRPAAAQFACTMTLTDVTCTNSGTATVLETNTAKNLNQNATTTNSGTANGFGSVTQGGGNATATNSVSNLVGIDALTEGGGNATVTNSGSNTASGILGAGIVVTTLQGGNATATNSGTNTGGLDAQTDQGGNATVTNSGGNTGGINVVTVNGGSATATNSGTNTDSLSVQTNNGGDATATNSGSNTAGISAVTENGGNATATNSGSNTGDIQAVTFKGGNATATNSGSNTDSGITVIAENGGNATVTNSGSNTGGIQAATFKGGNVTVTNSGNITGGDVFAEALGVGNATVINSGSTTSGIHAVAAGGNATVINSGIVNPVVGAAIQVNSSGATATLTNIVGGRVMGDITLSGLNDTVNFQGGNWLFTVVSESSNGHTFNAPTINTNGAPFVVTPASSGGFTIAVLDATTFALADRALTNFTGEVQQMPQGRFDGMAVGGGSGGSTPLGFAGAPSTPGLANEATQAFSGIPSVAMSYASDPQPLLGKAPTAAASYYDTTIWASGFGGERKQNADGVVLPATDIAYGGALGIDRAFGPNLRLGAFAGGGASREDVELSVQSIDSTYAFGGGYGRFDWVSQYLDFSLYGGGINNSSTRQVANNTVASGLEVATASYGGWFISPALTYGYRIPFKDILVTPRFSLRYVGGALDGFSESGSEQDLSVGRRSINDLEERAELEFSALKQVSFGGTVKSTIGIGAIGLERLGNQTIDTVLLGQNLSFVTPGRASAVGGVLDAGIQYHPAGNVSLFISAEGTAMSDRSYSGAATGGARVSF
jgi:uncharacterized protein with beta-barrel porin domain